MGTNFLSIKTMRKLNDERLENERLKEEIITLKGRLAGMTMIKDVNKRIVEGLNVQEEIWELEEGNEKLRNENEALRKENAELREIRERLELYTRRRG